MKSIEKVTDEIERLKVKISNNQARLKELEREKTEIENAAIVAAIRKQKTSEMGINELLSKLQINEGESENEN